MCVPEHSDVAHFTCDGEFLKVTASESCLFDCKSQRDLVKYRYEKLNNGCFKLFFIKIRISGKKVWYDTIPNFPLSWLGMRATALKA